MGPKWALRGGQKPLLDEVEHALFFRVSKAECQKMAPNQVGKSCKSFLVIEIGRQGPPKKCHLVPFSAIFFQAIVEAGRRGPTAFVIRRYIGVGRAAFRPAQAT
jgi:hypothetical protein